MRTKKLSFALVLLAATVSLAAAQTVDDAIELTRTVIQAERQAITAASMELTDSESSAFWPLYREYRSEIAAVDDRLIDLIEGYAESYDSTTETKARSMVNDFFDYEGKKLKVRKRFLKRFRKILPETKVARFVQIENKLDAVLRYQLAAELPLVR